MNNLFCLDGRNAVVIGGSGGIGSAIAEGLAAHGADVTIVSRGEEKLKSAAEKMIASISKPVHYMTADIADEESVKTLSENYIAQNGRIDILVNSQGLNKKFAATEHPLDEWEAMFRINVTGIMLTCKYFGRYMIAQKYGRIINISSIGAVRTKPTDISVCYGATKGAVNAYSLNLAAGWAKHGITVNCIGPIMTETPMMTDIFNKNPQIRAEFTAAVPMGRMAKPEDCIGPAVFFASEGSGFVTGQIIYADGGMMTLQ